MEWGVNVSDLSLLSSENALFARSKEQTVKGDQQNPNERGYQSSHTFEMVIVQGYLISEDTQARKLVLLKVKL